MWQSAGKTPEATVRAVITEHIRQKGHEAALIRTAPGLYALRAGSILPITALTPPPAPVKVTPPAAPLAKPLSFLDAAEQIITAYAHSKPLHYRTITEKALTLGLNSQGQTPDATMYSALLMDIDRCTKRGIPSRFVKVGKGFFALAAAIPTGLAHDIDQHNRAVREKLLVRLRDMHAKAFEEMIGALLVKLGFEVEVTKYSGDGGIDVRGTLAVGGVIRTRMAVQVKKWKPNVQTPEVQKVRGSLGTHEQGLIITTSDFSAGAREEAQRPNAVPVALMNGHELVELLIENEIGVRQRRDLVLIELDDEE
jgi:restriction system protein